MPKTKEQIEDEIEAGEREENLYSKEGREVLLDKEDEITDVDEGFMKGYEEGEKMAICQFCKKVLEDEVVERDFDGETYRFCSEQCADKFTKNRQK